mmetsp:Transcript_71348/g.143642  ORF Transcript_71348/g.143642 Transcript_71348/m.143642 type:complete len:94 (+) Transcript_71348:147-428(+)
MPGFQLSHSSSAVSVTGADGGMLLSFAGAAHRAQDPNAPSGRQLPDRSLTLLPNTAATDPATAATTISSTAAAAAAAASACDGRAIDVELAGH